MIAGSTNKYAAGGKQKEGQDRRAQATVQTNAGVDPMGPPARQGKNRGDDRQILLGGKSDRDGKGKGRAGNNDKLKGRINDLKTQLEQGNLSISERDRQISDYETQLNDAVTRMGSLEAEWSTRQQEQQNAFDKYLSDQQAGFDEQINQLSANYESQLGNLRSEFEAASNQDDGSWAEREAQLRSQYEAQLSGQMDSWNQREAQIRSEYEAREKPGSSEYESKFNDLSEQIKGLQTRYDDAIKQGSDADSYKQKLEEYTQQYQKSLQNAISSQASTSQASTSGPAVDSSELEAFREWQQDDASYGLQTLRGGSSGGSSVMSGGGSLASGGQAFYGGSGEGEIDEQEGGESYGSRPGRYDRGRRSAGSLASGTRSGSSVASLAGGGRTSGYYASRFRR